MAITFVGSEVNAADTATANWSGATNTAIAIPQPSGLQTNDLLLVMCAYRDANLNAAPAFASTGSEDWESEFLPLMSSGAATYKINWSFCRYSGTWGSPTLFIRDNQLETACTTTNPIIVASFAFRSSVSGYNLYQETASQMYNGVTPTGPPYDVATVGQDFAGGHASRTSPEANTVGLYIFNSTDDCDWTFQTAGWTSAFSGTDQIRRNANMSMSVHYQIKSDGSAFANVTNQQDATIGPDVCGYSFISFSERADSNFTDLPGSTSRYFQGSFGGSTDGHLDQFAFNKAPRSQFNTDWVFSGTGASLGFWIYFRSFTANEDPRLWVRHRTNRVPITGTRYEGGVNDIDYSWMIGVEPPSAAAAYPRIRVRWNNSTVTGVASTTAGQFLQGQWQYLLCTFDRSAGTVGAYLDATSVTFNNSTGYSTAAWDTTNPHKVVIGNNAPYDVPANGIRNSSGDCYIAHPAAWDKILTASEATALFNGADPRSIQGDSLIFYVPDMGANSTTDRDIIGGRTSTVYNAPGRAFGPPKFKKRSAAAYISTY